MGMLSVAVAVSSAAYSVAVSEASSVTYPAVPMESSKILLAACACIIIMLMITASMMKIDSKMCFGLYINCTSLKKYFLYM